jgi:hypothetical protein
VYQVFKFDEGLPLKTNAWSYSSFLGALSDHLCSSSKLGLTLLAVLYSHAVSAETYADRASWSRSGELLLEESGWFGNKTLTWNVRVNRRSIEVGERISVYKDGAEVKTFTVRTIVKWTNGNGIPTCALSWLDQQRPPSALKVTHCR